MTSFSPTVHVRVTVDAPFGRGQLSIPISRCVWEYDLFVPPPPRSTFLALADEGHQERYRADVKRCEEATQRLRDGVIRREAEKIIMQTMKLDWHVEHEF